MNDFDEAAEVPYALDLVRLAVNALLAEDGEDAGSLAGSLLDGYEKGLRQPRPLVLDRRLAWLRGAVIVPEDERADFWNTLEKGRERFHFQPPGA